MFPTLIASCFGLMCQPKSPWPHPASLLRARAPEALAAIQKGCENLHDYLRRYASLDEQNPDPSLREWARLMQACTRVESSYKQILEITKQDPTSIEAFTKVRDGFAKAYKGDETPGFGPSLNAVAWSPTPKVNFERLAAAIDHQRKLWQECRQDLQAAAPSGPAAQSLSGWIASVLDGRRGNDPASLDDLLTNGLRKADLTSGAMLKDYLDKQPFATEEQKVQEVFQRYDYILALRPPAAKDGPESVEQTEDARKVAGVLAEVDTGLAGVKVDLPDDLKKEQLAGWLDQFQRLNPESDKRKPKPADLGITSDRWQKAGLQSLRSRYQQWADRAAGSRLLLTIERRLEEKESGSLGPGRTGARLAQERGRPI